MIITKILITKFLKQLRKESFMFFGKIQLMKGVSEKEWLSFHSSFEFSKSDSPGIKDIF